LSQQRYNNYNPKLASRFRGYLPVIIDVETGGLDCRTDALLELAAITIDCDEAGVFRPVDSIHFHIEPFKNANFDPKSMEITGIDPFHPFRLAVTEKDMLNDLFGFLKNAQKQTNCSRSVLVGHNSWFDLSFLNAVMARNNIQKSPFHKFTSLDTSTIGMMMVGHTVLAEALKRSNIEFDANSFHSALYDATKTAEFFCKALNSLPWPDHQ
jgi:ribonuclease T